MQTLPHYTNVGHRLADVVVSAQLPWCYLSNIIMLLAHSNCWSCPLCQTWQLLCNLLTGTRHICWISLYLLLYVSTLALAHFHPWDCLQCNQPHTHTLFIASKTQKTVSVASVAAVLWNSVISNLLLKIVMPCLVNVKTKSTFSDYCKRNSRE